GFEGVTAETRRARTAEGFSDTRRAAASLPLDQQPQHRAKADAALAGQRRRKSLRPFPGIGPGKADADYLAAEHRARSTRRRVLVVDQFALPLAVGEAVRARI